MFIFLYLITSFLNIFIFYIWPTTFILFVSQLLLYIFNLLFQQIFFHPPRSVIPAFSYVIPAKAGIHPSVIASPDLSGRGNLYLQYTTGISPVIKNILKYFPQKEGFLEFIIVYNIKIQNKCTID